MTVLKDYSEIFLQSVQTLIDKSLSDLSVDRTIVCTIIDNSNGKEGQYKVQSENATIYDAFSDKSSYKLNEQVLVLFPQDDTKKKQIISKYSAPGDWLPTTYVPASDRIVQVTENLAQGFDGSIAANNNNIQFTELGTILATDLKNTRLFNSLYFKADFSCFLSQYDMREGNYGIIIEGYDSSAETATPVAVMQFDSKDMFGNPYFFTAPFSQEMIFHYNIDKDFSKLKIFLYQSNSFKYWDGSNELQRVPFTIENAPISNTDNIFVSNAIVYFAYDVESVANNTVKIFTANEASYDSQANQNKDISMIWYNKTESNKYIGFTDGVFDVSAKRKVGYIKTKGVPTGLDPSENARGNYIYTIENAGYTLFYSNDEYSEGDLVYYEQGESITSFNESKIIGLAPNDGKIRYWIEWLVDDENGEPTSILEGGVQEYTLKCRLDLGLTKIQIKLWRNGQSYVSNILEFTNTKSIIKNNISNLGIKLSFEHIAPGYSNYPLYGWDNQLTNFNEADKKRKIKAIWSSEQEGVSEDYFKNATIIWKIPKTNTMIKPFSLENLFEEKEDYYYFRLPYSAQNLIFEYLIKKVYYKHYNNNYITCEIVLPNNRGTAEGQEKIDFTSQGANGTDYIFSIDTVKPGYPWSSKNTSRISLVKKLFNGQGEELSTDNVRLSYVAGADISNDQISVGNTQLNYFNLIQGKCQVDWGGKRVNLETFLPLIYSKDAAYSAEAPTALIYDSLGTIQTQGVGAPLKLRNITTDEEYFDINWRIIYNTSRTNRLESPISGKMASWLPTLNNTYTLVGKMLDNNYVSFVAIGTEVLNAYDTCKFILDETNSRLKIDSSNAEAESATVLNVLSSLKQFIIKDNINFIAYTDIIKEVDKFYTIFDQEIQQNDLYNVLKDASQESRWAKAVFKSLGDNYEGEIVIATAIDRFEADPDAECPLAGGLFYLFDQADSFPAYKIEGTPDFTIGRSSRYALFKRKDDEYYYLLSPITEASSILRNGEYYRALGENIEEEVVEYRYLLSAKLNGSNIPVKNTFVNFDTQLNYIKLSSINNLRFGVEKETTLKVPPLYITTGYYCILQALDIRAYNETQNNTEILWCQPLPVQQFKYDSAVLNQWNGELQIDEDNNYILSSMLGAGIKNSDNTFSGVLMGDVGRKTSSGSISNQKLGLYGYHEGVQSFGFKVDGTAFLGKAGAGRIEFNGNEGLISSADGSMIINLRSGLIKAQEFVLDAKVTNQTGLIEKENAIDYWNVGNSEDISITIDNTKEGDGGVAIQGTRNSDGNFLVTRSINVEQTDKYIISFSMKSLASKNSKVKLERKNGNTWESVTSKEFKCNGVKQYTQIEFNDCELSADVDYQISIETPGVTKNMDEVEYDDPIFWIKDFTFQMDPIQILLNNNDPLKDILYIGRENHEQIQLTQDGRFSIKSSGFMLESGEWGDDSSSALILSSTPLTRKNPNNSANTINVLFGVKSQNGHLYFTDNGTLSIKGAIEATSGKIGSWEIIAYNNGYVLGSLNAAGTHGMGFDPTAIGTDSNAFAIGTMTSLTGAWSDANFRVTGNGKLYASGAVISGSSTFKGTLDGASGTFSGTLSAVSGSFTSLTATGNLTMAGNSIIFGNIRLDLYGSYLRVVDNAGVPASFTCGALTATTGDFTDVKINDQALSDYIKDVQNYSPTKRVLVETYDENKKSQGIQPIIVFDV